MLNSKSFSKILLINTMKVLENKNNYFHGLVYIGKTSTVYEVVFSYDKKYWRFSYELDYDNNSSLDDLDFITATEVIPTSYDNSCWADVKYPDGEV